MSSCVTGVTVCCAASSSASDRTIRARIPGGYQRSAQVNPNPDPNPNPNFNLTLILTLT